MSIRLFYYIIIIILIMLKYAIASLQHVEKDFNRREALIRIVVNADKEAKTSERIRFLLECKRASVFPKFISNSVRNVSYMFKNRAAVEQRRKVFCRQLLNEAIKEAFRTQAYRLRERKRLQRVAVHHFWHRLACAFAEHVYEEARVTSAAVLKKKFQDLCRDTRWSEDEDCNGEYQADEDHEDETIKTGESTNRENISLKRQEADREADEAHCAPPPPARDDRWLDELCHDACDGGAHCAPPPPARDDRRLDELWHDCCDGGAHCASPPPARDDRRLDEQWHGGWDGGAHCAPPHPARDDRRLDELWHDCCDGGAHCASPRPARDDRRPDELWHDCWDGGAHCASPPPARGDRRLDELWHDDWDDDFWATTDEVDGRATTSSVTFSVNNYDPLFRGKTAPVIAAENMRVIHSRRNAPMSGEAGSSHLGLPVDYEAVNGDAYADEIWYDCFTISDDQIPPLRGGFRRNGECNDSDRATVYGREGVDCDTRFDCADDEGTTNPCRMAAGASDQPTGPRSAAFARHADRFADPFVNNARFLNMTDKALPEKLVEILNKGPNFALSRSVNKHVLKDVEVGLERGAFALRWKERIDMNKPRSHSSPPGPDVTLNSGLHVQGGPPDPEHAQDTQRRVTLTPRFSDTNTKAAPTAAASTEQKLKTLKHKVMTIYKNHKPPTNHNHLSSDVNMLKELANDPDIVIKRSDKCKGLVVLPKSEYVQKAETITDGYQAVMKNPTPKLEAQTKRVIKDTLTGKVPDKIVRSVTPSGSRTAELYGLPKTHKTNVPLRPIVSSCGDPLDKLAWLLERIITQLLVFVPAHLTNTLDYLQRLSTQFPSGLPAGSIIFSVDVSNLYGSIPTSEAIEATLKLIEKHLDKVDTFGLTIPDIELLLKHCLENNYVRFGHKYFKQTVGVAMGSRIAPPLAIIFMDAVESLLLTSSDTQYQPLAYMRYIDDVLGVWTHGADKLSEYFNFLNNFHPALKFTIERTDQTPGGCIPFLDTTITVRDDGTYSTELYIKPMTAPIIIHYTSAHPIQCKRSVLYSQLLRAKRLGSDRQAQERGMAKITELFRHNGYPMKLIQRTKHRVLYWDNSDMKNTKGQSGNTSNGNRKSNTDTTYISLPYIDDTLARRVDGAVRASGLKARVAWASGKTLAKHTIRSALESPPCPAGVKRCNTCDAGLTGRCHTKNVVYKITCKLCVEKPSVYIGESKRRIRDRFNEHIRDAKNKTKNTPFGDHMAQKHPTNNITHNSLKISIERVCKDVADLKIAESIEIRNQRPCLNTQTSSWPLLHPPPYTAL